MSTEQTLRLVLELPLYDGRHVGFFHSGGKTIIEGWWEQKSGAEGGCLCVNAKTAEILDYDGCMDLPDYVKKELKELGIVDPLADP